MPRPVHSEACDGQAWQQVQLGGPSLACQLRVTSTCARGRPPLLPQALLQGVDAGAQAVCLAAGPLSLLVSRALRL